MIFVILILSLVGIDIKIFENITSPLHSLLVFLVAFAEIYKRDIRHPYVMFSIDRH